MLRRRPAALLVAAVLFAPALSGCGEDTGTEDAAATATSTTESTASATTTAGTTAAGTTAASASASSGAVPVTSPAGEAGEAGAPPFPADAEPDSAEAKGATNLTVTAVRAAAHDGFDRVVFEFSGKGTPGWEARYVDAATAEGSGNPVDVAGPEFLQLVLRGTTYPYESGATEAARGPVSVPGGQVVTGAFYDGTFEGQSLAYVGTRSLAPFRVYALTGPTRVVVDVATP